MAKHVTFLAFTAVVLLAFGQTVQSQERGAPRPGDPLAGLSSLELQQFLGGLEEFGALRDEVEGLGPAYNGRSCGGCHSVPALGGGSTLTVVRAGRRNAGGQFETLAGSTLFPMISIPRHLCQVAIPQEANVIARRISSPVFGAGLIEAIPDDALLALEDPDDRDQDGIRGRAALVVDPVSGRQRVGRFGWKAQHATLLAFAADALRAEMGITNDIFKEELAPGVDPASLRLCDTVADPEDVPDRKTGKRAIDRLEAYMRYLAPVAPAPGTPSSPGGEQLFQRTGCPACHTPALQTGPNTNPIFHQRIVRLFSDLLLHDVGTADGIPQAGASEQEFRTPPLWGLRFRRPFLHDGSASTLDDAIRRHAGEAAGVRDRYAALDDESRSALVAFLESL